MQSAAGTGGSELNASFQCFSAAQQGGDAASQYQCSEMHCGKQLYWNTQLAGAQASGLHSLSLNKTT